MVNMSKYALILLTLFIPTRAFAITATVTNTFSAGQKIVASQMNQNFNDVLYYINGQLTDTNITAGGLTSQSLADGTISTIKIADGAVSANKIAANSITATKMATGTSYYIQNYRQGCKLSYVATGSVYVQQPCELIVDGNMGRLSASATVTEANFDSGLFTVNKVFYVYGKPNASNGIDFQFSAATPTVTNARKPSDSTERYIGSVVTRGASSSINRFLQNGSRYRLVNGDVSFYSPSLTTGLQASVPLNYFVNVPNFSEYVYAAGQATSSSSPGICQVNYTPSNGQLELINIPFPLTGISAIGGPEDHRLILNNGFITQMQFLASSGCTNFQLFPIGYEEPQELY